MKKGWVKRSLLVMGGISLLWWSVPVSVAAVGKALIIDHTCTDIEKIPVEYFSKAKELFRVAYGHTSHGSQIVAGMRALMKEDPACFGFNQKKEGSLSLFDTTPSGDLGNPNRTEWARKTRDFLNGPGRDRTLMIWSWCGQVSNASEENIRTYLELMHQLEREFPKVTFVYMTGHLDGSGKEGNLNRRNEQIRIFCKNNSKVLFDFADIESYDPDARINYMELYARDTCDYKEAGVVKNWADEWMRRNPNHRIALPPSAAHTRPLNGALKGRAFWWMLARLAGWDGR
ncbi:MAG: hypothetical protein WDA18_03925 [Candidatus Ratteibacteria bacterium]|jgi:hypothetical protein